MLSKTGQPKSNKGFTIIEVLIVLAIAGLILLVVFLAVPALQRNSRNTQRTTDVGNILSAVNEFIGNNNGRLPDNQNNLGSGNTATVGSGTGVNTVPVNLGYYDASKISITTQSTYGTSNNTEVDTVVVVKGASCNGFNVQAGSSRSVVALYTLENDAKQCRES